MRVFKFSYLVVMFSMLLSCSSQSDAEKEKSIDSIARDVSQPSDKEEEEENEYIFEEKKANVSESQKKGVMLNVVRQYCQSQMEQDYTKLMSLFADSVLQYLSLKQISKEQVAQIAKFSHKDKKNIRYLADYSKFFIENYTLYIPIKKSWEGFSSEVQAEIVFDEAFNITAFKERPLAQAKIPLKKQWEGKYEFKDGSQIEAYLEIKAMQDRKFSFVVEINPEGNCKGRFEGKAVLIEDTEATSIETETCKLIFSLKDKQISIEEMPDCSLHSAICSFAGVYTKVK